MPNITHEIVNVVLSLICLGAIHLQTKACGRYSDGTRQRIGLFDVLKGVCIIGVVCIHAAYLTPVSLGICRTLDFAVPFFFVCSGFLLSVRCPATLDLGTYYRKLFVRILLIYLIFVVGTRFFKGGEMTVKEILLDIVLGRTNYNYYFMPLIIQFYILFPLLVRFREKLDGLQVFMLVMAASFFFGVCNHYIQRPVWNANPYYMVFIGKDLAAFCFGIFLARYDVRQMRFRDYVPSFLIFLAGTGVLMLVSGEYRLTYAYPFAAFIFALVLYNAMSGQRWLRIFENLGQYSLVVYLVHSTVQSGVVMKYLYSEALPWEIAVPVVVGMTVVLSYLCARMFMAVYTPLVERIAPLTQRIAFKGGVRRDGLDSR